MSLPIVCRARAHVRTRSRTLARLVAGVLIAGGVLLGISCSIDTDIYGVETAESEEADGTTSNTESDGDESASDVLDVLGGDGPPPDLAMVDEDATTGNAGGGTTGSTADTTAGSDDGSVVSGQIDLDPDERRPAVDYSSGTITSMLPPAADEADDPADTASPPTPTPRATPTPTPRPTPGPTTAATPQATSTPIATPTVDPSDATPTPDAADPDTTATAEPTTSATAEPTTPASPDPSPTLSAAPTATSVPTATSTPTATPVPTLIPTPTPCPEQSIAQAGDVTQLTSAQRVDVAEAVIRCAGLDSFVTEALAGVDFGVPDANIAFVDQAPRNIGSCMSRELSGSSRASVLRGLIALSATTAPASVDIANTSDVLADCTPPSAVVGPLVTALVTDSPEFEQGVNPICAAEGYDVPGAANRFWERLLGDPSVNVPAGLGVDELVDLFGPILDCLSFGTVVVNGAVSEGLGVPPTAVECIDAAIATDDLLVAMFAGTFEPDDPSITTLLIGCLSG